MDKKRFWGECAMLDVEVIEEDRSNLELEVDGWRQNAQEDERRERDS
tara:strand:- start:85 stop:225 length:141 start_codon:yes stop_codon:yes gene_type:complete